MMRTANPALNDKIFQQVSGVPLSSEDSMTLEGTVNKTGISIVLTMVAAYWTWNNPAMMKYALGFLIGGFVVAIAVTFKKTWAPVLTPVYAVLEGALLGGISLFAETQFPGIAFQAVSLTFGTLFCLLLAYRSGLIKATENFKLGVVAATGGIFFIYLVSFILNLFGVETSYIHGSGPLSIGLSCVVVVVAALNLVLDFDFIENAAESGRAPKYMEWYGAFGLLVTLVWLYIEILHLLMKLNSRD